MKSIIRSRFDRRAWLVVLLVCAVYVITNLLLQRLNLNSYLRSYVLPALLWGIVIFIILKMSPYRAAGKPGSRSSLIQMGFILGFCQVVFFALGGILSGFGKSPYSFTPLGIFTNLFLTGATLAGMELSRAWLLNHFGKRVFLSLLGISVLYAALTLSIGQLTGIRANVSSVSFANTTLLPALAESFLASLLALLAGPKASLAYRGTLAAFWTFCPILPDLSWVLKGLIGVVVPVLGLVLVWSLYASETLKGREKRQSSGGIQAGWIATTVVAVLIIWFAVGVFPIHPVLVASGSMTPALYTGDIAIVAKSDAKIFQVGDIIEFRRTEQMNVIHRVIDIDDSGGNKMYITKGDANTDIDDPVLAANVVGKVVFRIPKIGWVANAIKKLF
jgi:signal peptidase